MFVVGGANGWGACFAESRVGVIIGVSGIPAGKRKGQLCLLEMDCFMCMASLDGVGLGGRNGNTDIPLDVILHDDKRK